MTLARQPLLEPLEDSAPLPRDLLERVARERAAADDAERRVLVLAVEWARANPASPGQQEWVPLPSLADPDTARLEHAEDVEWHGLPSLRWDAPAAFAAANAMSTTAGKALIRDALVLAHRAPLLWRAVDARLLTAWQGRQVAQALLGQHDDVCRAVQSAVLERLADHAPVGRVVLDRLVDEAMLRLHGEERELDQVAALDRRHVTVAAESINHTGVVQIDAAADWADAAPFDETLTSLAEALACLPEHQHESLDVRRSIALGVLADPARALALLQGDLDAPPTTRRRLAAVLHLTDRDLGAHDPVVVDADGRAHLAQTVRAWVGRHDLALTVTGVRHCGGQAAGCTRCPARVECDRHPDGRHTSYAPSAADRQVVELRDPTCVHPYCSRPSRRCDCDHITPFGAGGPTCPHCNLAPLCRHHHRLKTHAGWRYWRLGPPGAYLWQDPHGLLYLRARHGTRRLD